MAGIEASMTLGGVADGSTYPLARALRQARSETIGVNDVLVPAPAGLRRTLPDRCLHVSCPGALNNDRRIADAPRYARNCPYSIDGNRRHPVRPPALRSAWWHSLATTGLFHRGPGQMGSQGDERLRGGTRSDPLRLSRHRRLLRRDAIDRRR